MIKLSWEELHRQFGVGYNTYSTHYIDEKDRFRMVIMTGKRKGVAATFVAFYQGWAVLLLDGEDKEVRVAYREATARRQDLQREFDKRRRQLPEARAYEAKCNEGHRIGIEPGKTFREFLGDLPETMRIAEAALRAELRLDDAWKRRAA